MAELETLQQKLQRLGWLAEGKSVTWDYWHAGFHQSRKERRFLKLAMAAIEETPTE